MKIIDIFLGKYKLIHKNDFNIMFETSHLAIKYLDELDKEIKFKGAVTHTTLNTIKHYINHLTAITESYVK